MKDANGLLRIARDFLNAAMILHERKGKALFLPLCYLYGHAIEAALKAFLRLHGCSVERTKELGHNLEMLVGEAHRFDLLTKIPLTAGHLEAVSTLNPYHKGEEPVSPDAGSPWSPSLADLRSCSQVLVRRMSVLGRKGRARGKKRSAGRARSAIP